MKKWLIYFLLSLSGIAYGQRTVETDILRVRTELTMGTGGAKKTIREIIEAISAASTHAQSPTAKAVYDWVLSQIAASTQTITRPVNTNTLTLSAGGGTVNIAPLHEWISIATTPGANTVTLSGAAPANLADLQVWRTNVPHRVGAPGCGTACGVSYSGGVLTFSASVPFISGESVLVRRTIP